MSSSLRTRITVALSFAAGAVLYASDHDTLKRHWRVALGLGSVAAVLALSPLWTIRATRGLLVAATAVAVGG